MNLNLNKTYPPILQLISGILTLIVGILFFYKLCIYLGADFKYLYFITHCLCNYEYRQY